MVIRVAPQKGRGVFYWSLPKSNDYQYITSSVIPKHAFTYNDVYNNSLISFLPTGSETITFNVQPQTISKTLSSSFVLDDYQTSSTAHQYLNSDTFINRFDKDIIALTQKIVGTQKQVQSIISSLYAYTLSILSYANPIDGLYTYRQALDEKVTDCGGYSTFLSSCLQSAGIPTRLVLGFVFHSDILSHLPFQRFELRDLFMHAWLEALLPDNTWFPLDPSVEWRRNKGLSKRGGGYGEIQNDRVVVSYGHNIVFTKDDESHQFDIVQKPIYL